MLDCSKVFQGEYLIELIFMFEVKLGMCVQKFKSCSSVLDTKNPWNLRKGLLKLSDKGRFSMEVFVWKKLLNNHFTKNFLHLHMETKPQLDQY